MEIPGIAPLSGQPTLTNPLSRESNLEGRETQAQQTSETQSTVTVREQSTTTVSSAEVVSQAEETAATGFDTNNPGGSIDITA